MINNNKNNKFKTGGLGKGLGALLGDKNMTEEKQAEVEEKIENLKGSSSLEEISLDLIEANPDQPRREFDSEKMQELADSIKQIGVIQAITVRKVGDKYQIISGERRYRASKLAGLTTIPAYVKDVNETVMQEMALVENIQREDLNAVEIAMAYQNLMQVGDYTQEQVSERVGKNRSTVTNYLRILRLPAPVQVGLKERKIEMGHARALLGLEDENEIIQAYQKVSRDCLSVRKTEQMVQDLKAKKFDQEGGETPVKPSKQLPEEYEILKNRLQNIFNVKSDLVRNSKGVGKITIPFGSDDELEKIMETLDSIKRGE
ncbi:MAG: ParB/RepB/Spo0J family partition protein [Bacteroidales bacterium]|nr:ParB/RepB/Spo0J family partition protein [Candidatus Scybalocola fimicaballi]